MITFRSISYILNTVIMILGVAGPFIGLYGSVMAEIVRDPFVIPDINVLRIYLFSRYKGSCFKVATNLDFNFGMESAFKEQGHIV